MNSYKLSTLILKDEAMSYFNVYKLYVVKGVGTYNYTFRSVVFESVKVKSVKIKIFLRSLRMVQKIICEKI